MSVNKAKRVSLPPEACTRGVSRLFKKSTAVKQIREMVIDISVSKAMVSGSFQKRYLSLRS